MSLVEHLDKDEWATYVRSAFNVALDVLATDPFRVTSSSVDDVRAWLLRGGVSRVRQALAEQMDQCRLPDARKAAVNELLGQLVTENRHRLLRLFGASGVAISSDEALSVLGFAPDDVGALWDRMLAGERPFEEWMAAQGHDVNEVSRIYAAVDGWLLNRSILLDPGRFVGGGPPS